MDMQASNVYTSIPGLPEQLGMVWMGDVMVGEPTHELMLDPRQAESPFFSHGSHPYEDLRNHHIAPMVRYIPQQFPNECSEPDEAMEAVDAHEIQREYDSQPERPEMNEYLTLEDYIGDEEREQIVSNAATQTTQDNRNRKIKPIKHPGLVLKTPIAYQPHTDLNFIPIRKDGIAVCEKCGAIGVKHAFYTKERRFCSRACARSSEHTAPTADSTYSPSHSVDLPVSEQRSREPETAEEPVGPDQTLPSPTTGQGQALSDTQSEVQSPPPPKERTATSYINVTSASSKYIPRLADGIQKSSESGDLVPSEWNVFDVAQFLRVNDCATYCDNFSKRKIDGKTLLTLTKDQIIDLTGFKVGPSLKIYDLIQQLKIKVNPAQERLKLGLKKLL